MKMTKKRANALNKILKGFKSETTKETLSKSWVDHRVRGQWFATDFCVVKLNEVAEFEEENLFPLMSYEERMGEHPKKVMDFYHSFEKRKSEDDRLEVPDLIEVSKYIKTAFDSGRYFLPYCEVSSKWLKIMIEAMGKNCRMYHDGIDNSPVWFESDDAKGFLLPMRPVR